MLVTVNPWSQIAELFLFFSALGLPVRISTITFFQPHDPIVLYDVNFKSFFFKKSNDWNEIIWAGGLILTHKQEQAFCYGLKLVLKWIGWQDYQGPCQREGGDILPVLRLSLADAADLKQDRILSRRWDQHIAHTSLPIGLQQNFEGAICKTWPF